MTYSDILYAEADGVARITINRPEVMNAFRAQTCEELIDAFNRAGWNRDIGVIVLTGAGEKAFCTGGDQGAHGDGAEGEGRAGARDGKAVAGAAAAGTAGGYDGRGIIGLPIEALHDVIREVPQPVIARVQGYAIGGGNVLATLCDLTIAGESARFGQVGPKVGSVDPGFGTAYLARVIGEKRAREMWYLCLRYSAEEAYAMGLANAVVPDGDLDAEVDRWCRELLKRSPTALAIAKRSFNADSDSIRGIGRMGMQALSLYYGTAESQEGGKAFREKRDPDFRKARDGAG